MKAALTLEQIADRIEQLKNTEGPLDPEAEIRNLANWLGELLKHVQELAAK
jgi:hypothetical protein